MEKKIIFTNHSDRVKCVDFHPNEPWILSSLYSGTINIWNYNTQSSVLSISISDLPVRTAKFIARKNWIAVGSDDMIVRIYNVNNGEELAQLEGHTDYIRSILVHPVKSIILTGSDDSTIRMWDWDRNWKCTAVYEGHSHYVMDLALNPKDTNVFASGSLDRTIKVWNISGGTLQAYYTIEGHEKGVNTIAYYPGVDKPYIVSGSDDQTIKIWDYQTRSRVKTLEGHSSNVSTLMFHPNLPLLLSGSEDGTVKIWSTNTFKLRQSLDFDLERIWSLTSRIGSEELAVGGDNGTIIFQIGHGEPPVCLDGSGGKIVWCKKSEVISANIQNVELKDGQVNSGLETLELGQSEIYPQWIQYNPSGRFIAVCGDGDWCIYSSLAFRIKLFGKGMDLCWSSFGTDFAIKALKTIKIYHEFAEAITISQSSEKLFGGPLLGVASSAKQLFFYDWKTGAMRRAIDIFPIKLTWNVDNTKVAIVCENDAFVLKYDPSAPDEDSLFELSEKIENEKILSCFWAGDVLIYTTSNFKLCYWLGGTGYQLAIYDTVKYIIGIYNQKILMIDKDLNIFCLALPVSCLDYMKSIMNNDLQKAESILQKVPKEQYSVISAFLQHQGQFDLAFQLSTDMEQKYELALDLNKLDIAYEIASEEDSFNKWIQLGDRALQEWKVSLAEKCFWKANDLSSLLLIYSASGNQDGLLRLAETAKRHNQFNISFTCYFSIGYKEECFNLLMQNKRFAEATIFARSYLPTHLQQSFAKWKLESKKLSNPAEDTDLFPDLLNIPPSHYDEDNDNRSTSYQARSRGVSFDSGPSNIAMSPGTSIPSGYYVDDHLSMEVNTTGTGSIRADEMDDFIKDNENEEIEGERHLVEAIDILTDKVQSLNVMNQYEKEKALSDDFNNKDEENKKEISTINPLKKNLNSHDDNHDEEDEGLEFQDPVSTEQLTPEKLNRPSNFFENEEDPWSS